MNRSGLQEFNNDFGRYPLRSPYGFSELVHVAGLGVNDAISSRSKEIYLHWFGSVLCFLLRCLHRTGIGTPFAFRLPASAPSVGGSGGAGRLAKADLSLHAHHLHYRSYDRNHPEYLGIDYLRNPLGIDQIHLVA
nr:hypothetical protein CFP56_65679 [Quercus suber]